MDMDPDIGNWILEFLLRQRLEDRTLNSLLRAVSLPKENPKLAKSLLLKKVESELSRHSISEITLELLEQLEEIEFRQGNLPVSDAMKRAYCAVAVDCTLKPLVTRGDGDDGYDSRKFKFFDAVKRLWRGRIELMGKDVGRGGLGSELLWEWKDNIEAAVWDDVVCKSVVKNFEAVDAEEAVRAYVREAREKMGPSFLEMVADRVKNDAGLQKILDGTDQDRVAVAEAETPSSRFGVEGSDATKEIETRKGKIKLRDKLIGIRHPRGMMSANSRGAKIVDSDETIAKPSLQGYGLPQSVEVNKARALLESSSLELRAAVKDPLPEALQIAEAIKARQNKGNKPAHDNHDGPKVIVLDGAGVVQSRGAHENNNPKPSLMEQNSTAHTEKCDDSIVPSLPIPKRINRSPLKMCEFNDTKKRRRGRRWSLEEEDALRAGVEKHGKGCWKAILMENREIFGGRTDVDLKDKWRNLTR